MWEIQGMTPNAYPFEGFLLFKEKRKGITACLEELPLYTNETVFRPPVFLTPVLMNEILWPVK